MFRCVINSNLEMSLEVDFYSTDDDGIPLHQKALTDPSITTEQRDKLQEKYWPKRQVHNTSGSRVKSQTGQYDDSGDVSELQFLQSLTPTQVQAMFPGETSFLGLMYRFIESKMADMDQRGKY